jgi:hypothetical protein
MSESNEPKKDKKPSEKGHGPGKVPPYTQTPGGGGGGHNWPKPGDTNTKGWPKK